MALPADYNTVQVRGKYTYLDGSPALGVIRFSGKIPAVSASTKTVIIPSTLTAVLDSTGQFQIDLPATDDPDILPNGWTYSVQEELSNGGGRTYEIDVPLSFQATGIELSTVAPVQPTHGDPTAFMTLSAVDELVDATGYEALPVSSGGLWTGSVDLTGLAMTACMIHATLVGNVTLMLPTPLPSRSFTVSLLLTQDATGGRTLTLPASCLSAYGVDPVLSTAGGAKDVVNLMWTGVQWIALMGAPAVA